MRVPTIVSLISLIPAAIAAQQAERFTVPGDEIAIYNLAGSVSIEPGTGPATVLVTRAGKGAAKLSIAQGDLDARVIATRTPSDTAAPDAPRRGLPGRPRGCRSR